MTGPADHPILQSLGTDWPVLLGANEVAVKDVPGVEVLATLPEDQGGHPLLVTGRFGAGRTAVWTSGIGPHWLPHTGRRKCRRLFDGSRRTSGGAHSRLPAVKSFDRWYQTFVDWPGYARLWTNLLGWLTAR